MRCRRAHAPHVCKQHGLVVHYYYIYRHKASEFRCVACRLAAGKKYRLKKKAEHEEAKKLGQI